MSSTRDFHDALIKGGFGQEREPKQVAPSLADCLRALIYGGILGLKTSRKISEPSANDQRTIRGQRACHLPNNHRTSAALTTPKGPTESIRLSRLNGLHPLTIVPGRDPNRCQPKLQLFIHPAH